LVDKVRGVAAFGEIITKFAARTPGALVSYLPKVVLGVTRHNVIISNIELAQQILGLLVWVKPT
jgi:hypothetical protein